MKHARYKTEKDTLVANNMNHW